MSRLHALVFAIVFCCGCRGDAAAASEPSAPVADSDVALPKSVEVKLYPTYHSSATKLDFYILPLLIVEFKEMAPWVHQPSAEAHYFEHMFRGSMVLNVVILDWRQEYPESSLARETIYEVLKRLDEVPEEFRQRVRNSYGCYMNHNIYWGLLTGTKEEEPRKPTGKLMDDIVAAFGSYDEFKERFTSEALNITGSGWTWLVRKTASASAELAIVTTANEDSPVTQGMLPLVALDVWEHAYYIKHQRNRAAYVDDWWMVLDWANVVDMEKFFLTGVVKYYH